MVLNQIRSLLFATDDRNLVQWLKMQKAINQFVCSSSILLAIAAFAKMISAGGDSPVLQSLDPVLAITFRKLLWIVAIVELFIATVCLCKGRLSIKLGLIAWLASGFLAYRFLLFQSGYHKPCNCLGNLTDALHISPQTGDTAMKIILAYLLIGSYGSLFWLWLQHRESSLVNTSNELH